MIKHYEEQPDIEKVYVIAGHKKRDGISYEQSQAIFKIYGGFSDKVQFLEAPENTRGAMDTCFKMLEINPEKGIDRPVMYPEIVEKHKGSTFSLGAGNKGKDPGRIAAFANYFIDNPERAYLNIKTANYEAAPSCEVDECPASASRMRKAFREGDWELFKKLLPDDNFYDDVVQVLNLQGHGEKHEPEGGSMVAENFLSKGSLFSLVDEVILEENLNININKDIIIKEDVGPDLEKLRNQLGEWLGAWLTSNADTREIVGMPSEYKTQVRDKLVDSAIEELQKLVGAAPEQTLGETSGVQAIAGFSGVIQGEEDEQN